MTWRGIRQTGIFRGIPLKKPLAYPNNGPISSNFFGINSFYLLFFIILLHFVYGTFDGKANRQKYHTSTC